jgi:3-oxoacyl-(acyl-carrier-protein) synthase
MKIFINGHGDISAAGTKPAEAEATYTRGTPRWSVDTATGLPVYRINELPAHRAIDAFADRSQPDRATLLALHAADRAVENAGWRGKEFAVLVGCSRGPTQSWEDGFLHFIKTKLARLRTSPQTTLGSIGFALANYFGVSSLADSLSVTCSSGMHAILHGVALLRAGMVDRVLVGGTEAPLTTFTLRQLEALRIYAEVPEAGRHACQPLSHPSSGMAIGEGAAFLALSREPADFTLAGITFAHERQPSPTGISPQGDGLARTMQELIAEAGHPDIIIAHAPGTEKGDEAELAAIRTVFGAGAPLVTSYKWATGHTFGASGPLALTAGLSQYPASKIMVNATGFGGNVVSVFVARTQDAGGAGKAK